MNELGFAPSNLVRVYYAFDGDSLTWTAPDTLEDGETESFYIPDTELIPPWVDPDIEYNDNDLTYVDGEWVNLDKIEIAGNKTVADIDMN